MEFFSCEKEVKTFLGVTLTISTITLTHIQSYLEYETAWKVSKYGPVKTPYFDTFYAMWLQDCRFSNQN